MTSYSTLGGFSSPESRRIRKIPDAMPMHDPGETSWSLIARAAAGDGQARSGFGQTYLPLVRSILAARWRGTPLATEVDDATQETFLECFRPAGPLARMDPAKGDFRDYLFGVVRRIAARFEERAARRQLRAGAADAPLPDPIDRSDGFSRVFDREWAVNLMREAGERMVARATDESAKQRVELLRLRFTEDLPVRAIAERWQMDVDAVHRASARAREEFRLCLREVVARDAVRSEVDLDAECRRLFEFVSGG